MPDKLDKIGGIGYVAIMEKKPVILNMGVFVNVLDPIGIKGARTAGDTVNYIALFEEQLGKIGTILPSYAGNEGTFSLFAAVHFSPCY